MKTFALEATRHPDLFRVVDREGNWQNYYHKPSDRYLTGVTTVLDRGYSKGKRFEEYLLGSSKEEAGKILKEAGEKGDRVHRAIEAMLMFGSETKKPEALIVQRELGFYDKNIDEHVPLENDEWDCLLSFSEFWKRHNPLLLASEKSVYNLEYGYAGTLDEIIILRQACGVKACPCTGLIGQIGLWDNKTSRAIRASYSAQEAAYARADNVKDYLPKGKSIEYIATLRLGTAHKTTGGYQVEVHAGEEAISTAFARFTAAKHISDYEYPAFDPAQIEDIPDSLEIMVERYQEIAAEKPKAKAKAKGIKKSRQKSLKQRPRRKVSRNRGRKRKSTNR